MKSIGVLAALVAMAVFGCEAMGPGDEASFSPQARMEVLPSTPAPGDLRTPSFAGIARPSGRPVGLAGTEIRPGASASIGQGSGADPTAVPAPVVVPDGGGTGPTVGLQYDGSIAFRRGMK